MKLATLRDGSRDGQLVVVSRDLARAHHASGIAGRLQQALDDWNFISPQLEDMSATLNQGKARHAFAFDPRLCMAPLPRAYQWACAPGSLPLQQHAGDDLLGPTEDARCAAAQADTGIEAEAGVAVVTGDLGRGCTPAQGIAGVRLLLLFNLWQPGAQPQPAAAFSPVALTADELGADWHGGRVQRSLQLTCNGDALATLAAGPAPGPDFGQLIALLAGARRVRAGSIVGSGALGPRPAGLRAGDRLRIEMNAADGSSLFGAIEQTVVAV